MKNALISAQTSLMEAQRLPKDLNVVVGE